MIASTQRIVKGIWVPIEIWCANDLNWNEKILLMEISSFTDRERDCYMSNAYIAKLLGVNETNANKTLSSLIKKGYVEKTRFDGRRRYVRSLIVAARQTCQEKQGRVVANDKAGLSPATTDLNKINNIPLGDSILSEESIPNGISSSSRILSPVPLGNEREDEVVVHRQRFIPPTAEEVGDYIRGRGPEYQSIDPEEFVSFYQSKGWKVGKAPMKDWRAALTTWARKRACGRPPRGAAPAPVIAPVAVALEENERTMRDLLEKARAELGDEQLKKLPI